MTIKIITGMSGGGKSTVLDSFEDMNYYCIDNLPPNLLGEFIRLYERMEENRKNMAVCMDLRLGVFFDEVPHTLDRLREQGYDVEIIFVEASDRALINRFREVRRSHPMEKAGKTAEAICLERRRLAAIKEKSDIVIDTTKLTTYQLKKKLALLYGGKQDFQVIIESFGMKNGMLENADFIFDLRFLINPYYVEELKELTGHDQVVRDYIMKEAVSKETLKRLLDFLDICVEQFKNTGRNSIHIGLGCTGGRHRSVTFSLLMQEHFQKLDYSVLRQDREQL
ncbi:MAG TPA: RNase adapter RapZ [Clostridia bacterium]|nr:RNase adapter RapZ [Clostridia bacterium]